MLRALMKVFSVPKNIGNYYKHTPLIKDCLLDSKTKLLGINRFQHQSIVEEVDKKELTETAYVIEKVNSLIHNKSYGRLFAIVQLCGKQHKITKEDLIVVEGYWPPVPGDKIRLEKVLLVGGSNFTLVGTPLLPKDQASVYATIVEKTMSPTILWFKKIRRKRYQKTRLSKVEQTFLRITSIDINVGVNEIGDVDGARDRIF